MVRHIVFWKFRNDEQKQANLEKMREMLEALTDKINGIVSAEVGFNFSSSEYDIILDVMFVDPFALKQYHSHPENIKILKFADSIHVDHIACDYMVDSAGDVGKQKPSDIPMMPQGMRAPMAGVNKNSGMMNMDSDIASSNGGYDDFDNNYNESFNQPMKRDTLASPVNNLDDSAFSLPYSNDDDYQEDDSFNIPFNKQEDRGNNIPLSIGTNQQQLGDSGRLPFVGRNNMPNGMQENDDSWKCPKCGKINPIHVNMCSCGRRKPMLGQGMPNGKGMMPKTQSNVLLNSGVLPNLNDSQDMKAIKGDFDSTSIIPLQPMPKGEQDDFSKGNDAPWKCQQCGNINSSFENVCRCGARKPSSIGGMKMPNGMQPPIGNGIGRPFGQGRDDGFNQDPTFGRNRNQQNNSKIGGLELPAIGGGNNSNPMDNSYTKMEQKGSSDGSWTCPNCGKVNGDFVGLCGCGQRKTVGVFNPSNNDFKQGQTTMLGGMQPQRKSIGMPIGGNKPNRMNQQSGGIQSLNEAISSFKSKGMQTINNGSSMNNNDMGFYDDNQSQFEDSPQSQFRPGGARPPMGFRGGSSMQPQGMFGGGSDMDSWKCPRCGKINGNFVGQCGCGQKKPMRPMNRMDY